MTERKYNFNYIENGNIKIKPEFKKKKKKYVDVQFNKKLISMLDIVLELISASPDTKVKFVDQLEQYIKPRFEEVQRIVHLKEVNEEKFMLEISKENADEIINGLTLGSVIKHSEDMNVDYSILRDLLKKAKYTKY